MPSKLKTPGGNRTWIAVLFIFLGLWITFSSVRRADWWFTSVALLMLICGVGLWFNQQWARWSAIAVVLILTGAIAGSAFLAGTFSLIHWLTIGFSIWVVRDIWKDFSPTKIANRDIDDVDPDREPMVSLVLLLREPRYLEARVLGEIVSSAWDEDFSGGKDESDDNAMRYVVGETPLFIIQSPEAMFLVHNRAEQYFDNMAGVLDHLKELRLHKAVEDHRAWLSVDLMSIHTDVAKETMYPRIASLIAELGGPDCTAIFQPGTGSINVWHPQLADKLRGPDCLEQFGLPANVPVIPVSDDDPRMQAAVAEARSRWPEFVDAFQKRSGEQFAIKAPITVGDNTEYIWVQVDGLEPEFIHGKLGNDPVDLGDMKLGDQVEIPVKELNDWLFMRDGQPVGLFTVKVVSDIEKE